MRAVVYLVFILVSAGCSLEKASLRLEESRLTLELSAVEQAKVFLTNPQPSNVSLFVSYGLLNQVLAGADGIDVPLPSVRNARLKIDHIRIQPKDGTPLLEVSASARREKLSVDAAVLAMLVFDQAGPDGVATFHVRFERVGPTLNWNGLRLGESRFLRTLATMKADELAVCSLKFRVPMQSNLALQVPPLNYESTVPTRNNGSWVRYRVTSSGGQLSKPLTITRVLFLRDGVHVFANVV